MSNSLVIFVGIAVAFAAAVFLFIFIWMAKIGTREKEEEMRSRMYELAILKEVGDRIGYSLNLEKIIDIITGSLPQFIEYSAASYMLIEPEKILFKAELERQVSKDFINDVKKRMTDSLSALLNKDISDRRIDEVVTGVIAVEEKMEPVRSFFNIPLVIGGNVVGVLTVAHTKEGLYKEKEMTLLYKIVGQASQAITKLEEVIKTERGKVGAMVESMSDGVVMTDQSYRVVVANPVARRIIGVDEDKDVTIFDFIDNLEGKFDIRGKLEEGVALDKIVEEEVVIRGRVFQIFVSPVRGGPQNKEILGGAVVFHDITHEKEVEKMREDFTSMMVHELRSPLDGVKKMGELMLKDDNIRNDKKTFSEYINMMYKSSSEMLELVNDLLDVSKLEAGKFTVQKGLADISGIIQERVKFFEPMARDEYITLSTVLGGDIPKDVSVDKYRVAQVINNFISNALKFTGEGGSVTVQTFAHTRGNDIGLEASHARVIWFVIDEDGTLKNHNDAVVVAVTDTGIGISRENMKNVWSKFEQFGVSRAEKRGTGLGLVIAKGIIEAHGGIIGVASEEGVGSTFYFTINV